MVKRRIVSGDSQDSSREQTDTDKKSTRKIAYEEPRHKQPSQIPKQDEKLSGIEDAKSGLSSAYETKIDELTTRLQIVEGELVKRVNILRSLANLDARVANLESRINVDEETPDGSGEGEEVSDREVPDGGLEEPMIIEQLPDYINQLGLEFGNYKEGKNRVITGRFTTEYDEQGNKYYVASLTRKVSAGRFREKKDTATVVEITDGYKLIVPETKGALEFMRKKSEKDLFYLMSAEEFERFKTLKNSETAEIDTMAENSPFTGRRNPIQDRQGRKYSVAFLNQGTINFGDSGTGEIDGNKRTADLQRLTQPEFRQYVMLMDHNKQNGRNGRRYCVVRPLFRTMENGKELEFSGAYAIDHSKTIDL